MEFINEYYGIIGFVIGLIIYLITHKEVALNQAKKIIGEFIFLAEKKSEELLLKTGLEKKQWVLENGYNYLPKGIRVVVSKDLFEVLIQEVFDKILGYMEKNKK